MSADKAQFDFIKCLKRHWSNGNAFPEMKSLEQIGGNPDAGLVQPSVPGADLADRYWRS